MKQETRWSARADRTSESVDMGPDETLSLANCLERRPELAALIRLDPPRILDGRRWRRLAAVSLSGDSLTAECLDRAVLRVRLPSPLETERAASRDLLRELARLHWPGWRILKLLSGTDRNRHQTAAFLRAVLTKGSRTTALLMAPPEESPRLTARLLSAAVLWWDELSRRGDCRGLHLLLPEPWGEQAVVNLSRLDLPVFCSKYSTRDPARLRRIYPRSPEASEVRSPYVFFPYEHDAPPLLESVRRRHPDLDLTFRRNSWELSYLGLRVLWCDEDRLRYWYDLKRPTLLPSGEDLADFEDHLRRVRAARVFPSLRPEDSGYQLGAELWLEAVVLRNLKKLDPSLTDTAYLQVPTCLDGERKVLDVLSVTGSGRLVVLELKADKDLDLIFQGLDYWERVSHHARRGDFQRAGYFPDVRLSDQPPLLYLVSPLFEFHRVLPALRRYLKPEVTFSCIGVNTDWRRGLKILRRFEF
jgi:hypothetical protein